MPLFPLSRLARRGARSRVRTHFGCTFCSRCHVLGADMHGESVRALFARYLPADAEGTKADLKYLCSFGKGVYAVLVVGGVLCAIIVPTFAEPFCKSEIAPSKDALDLNRV